MVCQSRRNAGIDLIIVTRPIRFSWSMCTWSVLGSFRNGNYTFEKQVEIGEGPGNRCVTIKTGEGILPELHYLQINCRPA